MDKITMITTDNLSTPNTTIENITTHKGTIGLPENKIFVPRAQAKIRARLDQLIMSAGVLENRIEESKPELDEQRKLDDERGINDGR